jgi:hypothetical protein
VSAPIAQGMNLTELRRAFPAQFYRQDWFLDEAFMRYLPSGASALPVAASRGGPPSDVAVLRALPRAVDLAHAFLRQPNAYIWRSYLWTCDTDTKGQRVYVGGACPENGHRFEIHRHLFISDQWVIAA